MSSPVAGAWESVSDTRQGLWVFTETHYSFVSMPKGRQRIEGREPTSDEMVEAYRTVNALTGSYTVSGSTLTLHRTANLRSEVTGLDVVAEFTVEGDRLRLRSVSGTSAQLDEVFRKVG